jgi:hypothetical protein
MNEEEELESLRQQALTAATSTIPLHIKVILGVLVVALVFGGFAWLHNSHLQKAQVVSAETFASVNALQNKLDISEANAVGLKKFYDSVKTPVATYYVTAPSVETAASKVVQQINSKDQSLPPAALATADRTTVVPNVQQQKVDVFKISLDKAKIGMNVLVLAGDRTEVGVGPSWKNRDNAVNAGYTTRNNWYGMAVHYF